MKQWEFDSVRKWDELVDLGLEGWELVSALINEFGIIYFVKRERQ